MWPFDSGCDLHRYKEIDGGYSIDGEGDVTMKLLRCADCGETASLDHQDELGWSYRD